MDLERPEAGEDGVYARWLDLGTRAGLAALAIGFLLYALGRVEPLVPVQDLARLWRMPLAGYLAASGAPTGWGWLQFIGRSDYFNFIGIGMLGLVTAACYARIIPPLLARGEHLYAGLAIAQVLVLLAAASGLVGGSP